MDEYRDIDRLLAERAWLHALAAALLRGDAAEDAVQDAYVVALQRPRQHLRSPRAWLGTIVRNLARNEARAGRRRYRRERRAAREEQVESPHEVLARAELIERVGRMVLALDEPYRTTLVLRYLEELSTREVAARMEAPLETTRTRIRRALGLLRARLEAETGGPRQDWRIVLAPLGPSPSLGGPVAQFLGTGGAVMSMGHKVAFLGVLALLLVGAVLFVALGALPQHGPGEIETSVAEAPSARADQGDAPKRDATLARAPSLTGRNGIGSTGPGDAPEAAPGPPDADECCGLCVHVLRGGRPLAGASVEVARAAPGASTLQRGRTDDGGVLEIEGLPVGPCAVTVWVSEQTSWTRKVRNLPGSPGMVIVRVPRDETVLEGMVQTHEDGRGIAGASVSIGASAPLGGGYFWTRTRTAADGSYRVALPRGGINRFEVRAADFAPWPAPDDYRAVLRTLAGLASEGPVHRDVSLVRGGTIHGVVRSTDGRPLEGASVRFRRVLGPYTESAVTEMDGTYRIRHVNAGTYDLLVRKDHWFVAREQTARFELDGGESRALDVVLTRGRRLAGIVRGARGEPAEGVSVWIVVNGMSRSDLRTVTDGRGRWCLDDVHVRTDQVAVRAAQDGLQAKPVTIAWNRPPPESVTLELEPGCTIRGAVVEPATRAGVAGARVLLRPDAKDGRAAKSVNTDADGGFVARGLLPGAWHVTPNAQGYHRAESTRIEAVRVKETTVTLELDPGVVFAGVVVDEAGQPVYRATVWVRTRAHDAPERSTTRKGQTDRQGAFRISTIPPGAHELTASWRNRRSESLERQDGDTRVHLRVLPAPR